MFENGLKTKISAFPTSPGVYLHKDKKGHILYVGKAKSLRSRVRSYFGKSAALGPAKEKMVSLIADIDVIATHTELEALVLEATLVRKHQPPYNVLLRDDKFYLFIKITKENPPRIFPVRKITQDGSRYFGPYSSAASVRTTLRLLQRIFPFKGEKDSPHDIVFPHGLFKDKVTTTSYKLTSENVISFLKGNRKEIIKTLEEGIKEASDNLEFERAALFRDQLNAILRLEGSQTVYLPRKESFDVVSIAQDTGQSAGNILQIREGKLIGKQTFLLRHRTDADPKDILRQFLIQYYAVAQDIPKQILLPVHISDQSIVEEWIGKTSPVQFLLPQRGVRRELMAMGTLNAKAFLQQQGAAQETMRASKEALHALLKAIGVDQQPHFAKATRGDSFRVETYDISNIQGTLATASMVVFVDGMPDKKEYRKFKIKYGTSPFDPTQGKPNDFAMLEETLTRRLANDTWPKPNLIIIDGGKGQLSSAMKSLRKSGLHIPIISIAKREEEIFLPERKESVRLPYDSPGLYLIQRMRDEAHRFTITYHKSLRGKEQIKSILDEVPGIGPKTKKLLLRTFGSVKGIKAASDEDLEQVIGKQKTKVMREYL